MVDIIDVVRETTFPRSGRTPVDLRKPRQPRQDLVAPLLRRRVIFVIRPEHRARTDETHLTRQNIEKLRQLVERRVAHKPAELRQTLLVGKKIEFPAVA